jgi:hypothetical protein
MRYRLSIHPLVPTQKKHHGLFGISPVPTSDRKIAPHPNMVKQGDPYLSPVSVRYWCTLTGRPFGLRPISSVFLFFSLFSVFTWFCVVWAVSVSFLRYLWFSDFVIKNKKNQISIFFKQQPTR